MPWTRLSTNSWSRPLIPLSARGCFTPFARCSVRDWPVELLDKVLSRSVSGVVGVQDLALNPASPV
jgi:hypothetical protein